jgi:hypothetical protein
MARQDDSAERGEAKKDKAEDCIDEAEEAGAVRCGMKRTMKVSAENQVIRPAVAIKIHKPGALYPKTEWAKGNQLAVTQTQ